MNYKKFMSISGLSNLLINIGLILSILNLYFIYTSKKALPQGACAINNNREFIILSICITLVGLVLSFFSKKETK